MQQKEALKILVQLVQVAQRRGSYSIDESYLGFHALSSILEDPKMEELKAFVRQLESGGSSDPSTPVSLGAGSTSLNTSETVQL